MAAHGVEGVTTMALDPDDPSNVLPESERFMECDTVVLSAGLIPNRELIDDAPIEMVASDLRLDGSRVFVAGNSLEIHDLADGASRQGEIAAANAVHSLCSAVPQSFEPFQTGAFVSRWSARDESADHIRNGGITCIVCPHGCVLTEKYAGCHHGEAFLKQERVAKHRVLTTTTWAVGQDVKVQRVAVRTPSAFPLSEHCAAVVAIKTGRPVSKKVTLTPIGFESDLSSF